MFVHKCVERLRLSSFVVRYPYIYYWSCHRLLFSTLNTHTHTRQNMFRVWADLGTRTPFTSHSMWANAFRLLPTHSLVVFMTQHIFPVLWWNMTLALTVDTCRATHEWIIYPNNGPGHTDNRLHCLAYDDSGRLTQNRKFTNKFDKIRKYEKMDIFSVDYFQFPTSHPHFKAHHFLGEQTQSILHFVMQTTHVMRVVRPQMIQFHIKS